MTKVVISLVTYNGEKYLQPCLESIERQTLTDYELVVLDNASNDGSLDVVSRIAPHARIIASEKNIGFAKGHNEVIRITQSEYVCVINQDLVLEPDYLEQCVHFMDSHLQTGSVTGVLIRVPSLTAMGPRDTIDTYGLVISKAMRAKDAGAGMSVASVPPYRDIVGVSATAALYRRTALEDVAIAVCVNCEERHSQSSRVRGAGEDRSKVYMEIHRREPEPGTKQSADCECRYEYFDEDFFMYKEDVDLALRLQARGWRAAPVPDARGYHIRTTDPALLKRPSVLINQWSYRNQIYILIKDVSASHWLKYGAIIDIYEIAKFFYLLLFERSTLAGLADVWRNRKKMLAKRNTIMNSRATVQSQVTSHLS